MGVSASGLRANRLVIDAVSLNLANVQTTRTDEGGPYRKRKVIFSSPTQTQNFLEVLNKRLYTATTLLRTHPNHLPILTSQYGGGEREDAVKAELFVGPEDYQLVYDPNHPDSDRMGYIKLPNINVVEEMVNLLRALRSFEANITAFNAAKDMVLKALEIGR